MYENYQAPKESLDDLERNAKMQKERERNRREGDISLADLYEAAKATRIKRDLSARTFNAQSVVTDRANELKQHGRAKPVNKGARRSINPAVKSVEKPNPRKSELRSGDRRKIRKEA
jgi:hypothetical protein